MASYDSLYVSKQAFVVKDKSGPENLGRGAKVIRGSTYTQGPEYTGDHKTFETVEATVMIGPTNNTDSPIPWVCDDKIKFIDKWEFEASICGGSGKGAQKYGEKLVNPYSLVVRKGKHKTKNVKCKLSDKESSTTTDGKAAALFIGDVDLYGYTRVKEDLSVCGKGDFKEDVYIYGELVVKGNIYGASDLCVDGKIDGIPTGRLLDRILVADARPKPFDMVHPSLGEGNRLRYACIEGPEVGVYFRGRIKNETEIELPWYWKDLVHVDSISVQLQSIGSHQDVIVKRWDAEKIYLQSKGGMPIDCFYHVYAERKDVNALVTEYVGETWKDYPDSTYDDPQFADKINTKTV